MWIPVDNENMAEASAFVTSIRRMCPMAGMPASCSRRLQERCCAETCLPGLETALHSPKMTSSNLQSLRKICSTTPVLVRLQGRPFASLLTSNRRFWLPCTVRHFPVTGQLPLGPWVTTTTFACARHRAKLSFSPRCLLMAQSGRPQRQRDRRDRRRRFGVSGRVGDQDDSHCVHDWRGSGPGGLCRQSQPPRRQCYGSEL